MPTHFIPFIEMKRLAQCGVIATLVSFSLLCVFPLSPSAESAAVVSSQGAKDVKALWDSSCAKCHGRDGRSKTMKGKFTKARDLTEAKWQTDVSDEHMYNSIQNGRGKMPAFGKKLSEAQIDALVGYVRQLRR